MAKIPYPLQVPQLYFKGGGIWSGQPDPVSSWLGVPDFESYHATSNPTPWPYNPVTLATPDRPTDWSSEIAGYYFIDEGSGQDSGRTYGTPSAPRATLPSPIPAGSYVEVAGDYSNIIGGVVPIEAAGNGNTWAANTNGPVFIVSNESNPVRFTGAKNILFGTHLIVDGCRFNWLNASNSTMQIASTNASYQGSYITARNCEVDGFTTGTGGAVGVASDSSGSPYVHHVCLYNLNIHTFGPTGTPDFDRDYQGVAISDMSEDIFVLECTINDVAGTGIAVSTGSSSLTPAKRVWVAGNHIYNCWQSALWCKNGEHIIFSQNLIHDVKETAWSPSKGMGAQYFPESVWYLFNTVYNCRYAGRIASTNAASDGHIYFIGNLLYDLGLGIAPANSPWDTSAIHCEGSVYRYIVDNTIHNSLSGIHLSNTSNTPTTEIHGNIVSEITHADGKHFYSETTALSGAELTENHWYDSGALALRNGYSGTAESDLAQWKSDTGSSVGDTEGDPLFTNAGTDDYTLQSGSPCVDTGEKHAVYTTFYNTYGISIDFDNDANSRPVGVWDKGAFERVA